MRLLAGLRAAWITFLVAAGVVAAAPPVHAQATGSVRGRVADAATGRPLAGVQVFVVGSGRGTLTNAAGDYVLQNVPAGSLKVRAEMIGYSAAEQTVVVNPGEAARFDFTIAQIAISLDELVVTGTPGATQKRAIGNSVSTIQAAQVTEAAPISTVTQLLQGRTPGLTIMAAAGSPGTASNIKIRGISSYQAGNSPVFYLDGVRIRSGTQSGFGVGGQETSALDALNPEDIESIEVIKGPAAATLYGADAAAGVIQIITKKGKTGQQGLQWSAKAEMGQTDWALDMPTNYTMCDSAKIANAAWVGCKGKAPGTLLTEQPLKDALRTGHFLNTSLTARGGGERFSFYLSGDRSNDQGVFSNSWFNRSSGRANFFVTPTDHFDVTVNLSYTNSTTQLPNSDNSSNGWTRNAFRGKPGYQGPYAVGWANLGPTELAMYDNSTKAERWIVGSTVNYQPASWFRNRLTAGFDAGARHATLYYRKDQTGKKPYGNNAAEGYIDQLTPQTRNYTLDYVATASHKVPVQEVTGDFSFGMQYNASKTETLNGWGIGLFSDSVRLVGTAAKTYASESFSETRSLGFFAQEQVGWKNRVFVTGALRMDNSSVFGAKIQRLFYPKLSASYVISEEDFFHVPGVDQLRLRGAWGRAGNAPSPFAADRTYAASTLVFEDGTTASIMRAGSYGNPDLKAETGSELELGFEASLFGNRAGLDVTYYNNSTYDALIPVSNAPSSGYTGSTLQNVGEINNKGLEIALHGSPLVTRHVTWESRLGVSTNSNTFVSFGGKRDEMIRFGYRNGVQAIAEGYPMAGYWAQDVQRDASGNPVLDDKGKVILLPEESAKFIGSSTPTREASWTNTITILKNIRLYTYADYKGGHWLFQMDEGTRDDSDRNTYLAQVEPNSLAFNMRINGGNLPYLHKADFVKLREVSVTYDVPRTLSGRVGLKAMSIALAGRNLALWTKYPGTDPESNIDGAATFNRGDLNGVPMLRRLVTTVNVHF
jgi:TonB-linked SusC/RagA family outer membrane protein